MLIPFLLLPLQAQPQPQQPCTPPHHPPLPLPQSTPAAVLLHAHCDTLLWAPGSGPTLLTPPSPRVPHAAGAAAAAAAPGSAAHHPTVLPYLYRNLLLLWAAAPLLKQQPSAAATVEGPSADTTTTTTTTPLAQLVKQALLRLHAAGAAGGPLASIVHPLAASWGVVAPQTTTLSGSGGTLWASWRDPLCVPLPALFLVDDGASFVCK